MIAELRDAYDEWKYGEKAFLPRRTIIIYTIIKVQLRIDWGRVTTQISHDHALVLVMHQDMTTLAYENLTPYVSVLYYRHAVVQW